MSTIRERILAYLGEHPEGADDGELTAALNIKHRAQTNKRCRQLVKEGLLERHRMDGRLRNFFVGATARPAGRTPLWPWGDEVRNFPVRSTAPLPEPSDPEVTAAEHPWFWEGNVQSAVVTYLVTQGHRIISCADTASKQQGKDIVGENDHGRLWVSVKGYPKGTARTQPSTQAGHWFKQGFFDIVAYRSEDADVQLALALPDFPRYRSLAEKVRWLMPVVPFHFLWVGEDGSVEEEHTANE